jgi:hypothetical protein
MLPLIGADPEVFLFKDGEPVSAHGLIPGTKTEPFKVKSGAIQVDGTAAEFNIDPAASEEEFFHNIKTVMDELQKFVPGYEIRIQPTVEFSSEYFNSLPEESKELGCDPDFDASRDGAQNMPPDNKTTMRTGAGHVHLGFTEGADPRDKDHLMRCITLVRHLDVFLGMPSLLWDKDTKRRNMYGKAGAFRPKSYGVEYRTLSNAWLRDDELIKLVYRNSVACVESLLSGDRVIEDHYKQFVNNINASYDPSYYFRNVSKYFAKVEMPRL